MSESNPQQPADKSSSQTPPPAQAGSSGTGPYERPSSFEVDENQKTYEEENYFGDKDWRLNNLKEAYSSRTRQEKWSAGIEDEENIYDFDPEGQGLAEGGEHMSGDNQDLLPESQPLHMVSNPGSTGDLEPTRVEKSESMLFNPMDEEQTMQAQEFLSEIHQCNNVACKCNVSAEDFCGDFCEVVDPSEDDRHCGCGHTACDITKQLGNEGTFSPTGS